MKSLVTGATGFIGSGIVRALLKDGIEVKVLIRKTSDTKNIDGLDVEIVYGDIRDRDSMKAALKGCDTLYQTAGLHTYWMPDSRVFYDINVEGTKTALQAALEQGMEKVVYTSTNGTIGFRGPNRPGNEQTEFNLWKMGSHYVRSKYLGEVEAFKFYKQGLPLVIVNPADSIGVRDIKPTPVGSLIVSILNNKMPGYIEGGFNTIDVEDVARGHILAARKGKIGERYILGNQNLTIKEFFELIREVSGVSLPRLKIPYPAAIAIGGICQLATGITRKPPFLDTPSVRMSSRYAFFDCSKAVIELGLPQTPVKTAMEKAVHWFQENGYVKR